MLKVSRSKRKNAVEVKRIAPTAFDELGLAGRATLQLGRRRSVIAQLFLAHSIDPR